MTKRLLSLALILMIASGTWADDIISSQTLWTFDDYTGQTSQVYNYHGIYLHSAKTSSPFDDINTDDQHAAVTSGTFEGTSIPWSASKVLTCQNSAFLTINYDVPGNLYVVYGATSMTDGQFYIRLNETTSLYEEEMNGLDYTGPLGTRENNTRTAEYKFSKAEAAVKLSGSGIVKIGGTQPYCIYAILFVPEFAATYDFLTAFDLNISNTKQTVYFRKTDGSDGNGNFYAIHAS